MVTETVTQRAGLAQSTAPPARERPWPPAQGQWTREDWERLPDDAWRYEVIGGVLHTAPPPRTRHQRILAALFGHLWSYIEQNQLGEVIPAPCAVQLPNQPLPVQPDILFVRAERIAIIGEMEVQGPPDLVVEVLSPSNWLYDRREKFTLYQEAGVPEFWIVDPDLRTVEVFVLRGGVYAALGRWEIAQEARSETLTGFVISVAAVFGE